MTNRNVTLRHARSALRLLVKGAIAEIEAELAATSDEPTVGQLQQATVQLHDEMLEALAEFEYPGSRLSHLEAMVDEMHEHLGRPDGSTTVRELLAAHDLQP